MVLWPKSKEFFSFVIYEQFVIRDSEFLCLNTFVPWLMTSQRFPALHSSAEFLHSPYQRFSSTDTPSRLWDLAYHLCWRNHWFLFAGMVEHSCLLQGNNKWKKNKTLCWRNKEMLCGKKDDAGNIYPMYAHKCTGKFTFMLLSIYFQFIYPVKASFDPFHSDLFELKGTKLTFQITPSRAVLFSLFHLWIEALSHF